MATGTVRFFNDAKGFGLITPDDASPPLFVHRASISIPGIKTLKAMQRVEFTVEDRPEGLTATGIRLAR